MTPSTATVAIWCSADRPGFGDQVTVRVLERELSRRLPGWRISLLAPFGWTRPHPADGGLVAEPLGEPTARRVRQLAAAAHLTLLAPAFPLGTDLDTWYGEAVQAADFFNVGLGDGLGAGLRDGLQDGLGDGLGGMSPEAMPAVLPFAVRVTEGVSTALFDRAPLASVRDEGSLRLLRDAGGPDNRILAGPSLAGIEVVPHPAVLAADLVEPAVLQARIQQLRQLGALPAAGSFVVLHLTGAQAPFRQLRVAAQKVAQIKQAQMMRARQPDSEPDLGSDVGQVVVLATGPLPADVVAQLDALGWPVAGPDLVLEDRLAVLAAAELVLAADEHVAVAAAALGRGWLLFDPTGAERGPLPFAPAHAIVTRPAQLVAAARKPVQPLDLAPARDALADHLDAVAALAEKALAARGGVPGRLAAELAAENDALRRANRRLRERMFAERQALVERLAAAPAAAPPGRAPARPAFHQEKLLRQLTERLAAAESELATIRQTKLMRWSRPARELYRKLR